MQDSPPQLDLEISESINGGRSFGATSMLFADTEYGSAHVSNERSFELASNMSGADYGGIR